MTVRTPHTARPTLLVFSVPFGGHLTILGEFIRQYGARFDIRLVVTGWSNISPALADVPCPVDALDAGELRGTDPALWTFPRMERLLPQALAIARTARPDVILYDFFSPEGYVAAKLLGIPAVSSIPAMVGAFTDREYLAAKLADVGNVAARRAIADRYGWSVEDSAMELMSDGIHIPGDRNIVWTYRSVIPTDWHTGRGDAPYAFVGNIRGRKLPVPAHDTPVVYFSFGTVVMDNLWNRQSAVRSRIRAYVGALADILAQKRIRVVFVSQGKQVLDRYPENWEVYDRVDQIALLARADVFLTHGGDNSFNEALVQGVPMVCIPFFGDQPLVGSRIDALGIGQTLVPDSGIDTNKSKTFLSPALARRTAAAIMDVLGSARYRDAIGRISFETDSLEHAVFG